MDANGQFSIPTPNQWIGWVGDPIASWQMNQIRSENPFLAGTELGFSSAAAVEGAPQQKTEFLLCKKALEEKIDELEQGICPWRKPLEEWLKQAQNAGKTALSPSLSDKKSLLQKICGVNLSLQNRKVVFTPQNQWASLRDALEKKSYSDVCLVLVEMPGVKPGSKTCSSSNCSQD